MSKDAVTDWSTTAASNTDIGGTSIQGTAAISNFDNAFRELMAQIANHMGGAAFPGLYYDLAATLSFPASVKTLVLNGRTAFGDRAGRIPVKRTNAPVTSHNGWFRSVDRYLLNGTTNATNGGYWEFNVGDFANVVAFGAVSNGTTNDHPAIQGAINYINAKWGFGQVYFPGAAGAYLCTDQITLDGAVIDMFGANKAVTIHSGPNDICLLRIDTGRCRVYNLTFLGTGSTGLPTADTDSGITCTNPCVWLSPTTVDVRLEHCIIKGGTGLLVNGGDNKLSYNEVTRSYGSSLTTVSSGHYFHRNAMDQEWPISLPNYQGMADPMPAWTAGEVVVAGDVRELSGFYIQCRVGGTCGGSTPALKNYVVDITDGATVKWRLICKNDYAAFDLGPAAQEVSISLQDISGCFPVGVRIDDTNTTLRLKLRDTIIGQTMRQALLIQGGKDIKIYKMHTGTGFQEGYPSIEISGNPTGHVSINDNFIEGGDRGIYVNLTTPGSASVAIINNYVKPVQGDGTDAVAIEVAANQTDFYLDGNVVASGALDGVIIGSGCDHYDLTRTKNKARLADADFIQGVVPGPNIFVEGNV